MGKQSGANIRLISYQVDRVVEWILPELGHPDEGFVRVGKDIALELEESEMHFWVL